MYASQEPASVMPYNTLVNTFRSYNISKTIIDQ